MANSTHNRFWRQTRRLSAPRHERTSRAELPTRATHCRCEPSGRLAGYTKAAGVRTEQFATKTRVERTRGQWQACCVRVRTELRILDSSSSICVSGLRRQLMQMNCDPARTPLTLIGAPCVSQAMPNASSKSLVRVKVQAPNVAGKENVNVNVNVHMERGVIVLPSAK